MQYAINCSRNIKSITITPYTQVALEMNLIRATNSLKLVDKYNARKQTFRQMSIT